MFIRYLIFFVHLILKIDGHGYLLFPPSRSSLYRVKDRLPNDVSQDALNKIVTNYNDNELNCGGLQVSFFAQKFPPKY